MKRYIVNRGQAANSGGLRVVMPSAWKHQSGSVGASFDDGGSTNTDADTSYGDTPDCSNATLAEVCNPASDCWDEAKCKAMGGVGPQSNFCNATNMIKTVQAALGVKVDGLWGCESQCALDKSGKTFKELAGQDCQGDIPKKTGCTCGGGHVPPVTKKKLGEACTAGTECEAGLECIDGKCAEPLKKDTAKSSSMIWWVLGGLLAGTAIVGVAYAGGAFDDKKGQAKKAPAA